MKNLILLILLSFIFINQSYSQNCDDVMRSVLKQDVGMTYNSYNSDAISSVSFHTTRDNNYNTFYFAIVQFKSSYNKYIYKVGSNTQFNYSNNYMSSAGKAFHQYINPYNGNLGCAPSL